MGKKKGVLLKREDEEKCKYYSNMTYLSGALFT